MFQSAGRFEVKNTRLHKGHRSTRLHVAFLANIYGQLELMPRLGNHEPFLSSKPSPTPASSFFGTSTSEQGSSNILEEFHGWSAVVSTGTGQSRRMVIANSIG